MFTSGPDGTLRLSGDVYVSAARYEDIVLWHYAFARHWFKVNLTTDLVGQIVDTGKAFSGGTSPDDATARIGGRSGTALPAPGLAVHAGLLQCPPQRVYRRRPVGTPCCVPVESAGQAGRLARCGEGIHAVD